MKNWQTTLTGIVGGLLTAYANGGFHDWKGLAQGAFVALLGLVAKDHNVTGGNKTQGS